VAGSEIKRLPCDSTFCVNVDCPLREVCARSHVPANCRWASMAKFNPDNKMECPLFVGITDKVHDLLTRKWEPAVIGNDDEGYTAYLGTLPGVTAVGDTFEEAVKNFQGAARLWLVDAIVRGEQVDA